MAASFVMKTFYSINWLKKCFLHVDSRHANKIKNDKILRWRIELSLLYFTVVHRPGKENVGADTLNRAFCGAVTVNRLRELHVALCHPGVTRMAHFVRTKNLPYSLTFSK